MRYLALAAFVTTAIQLSAQTTWQQLPAPFTFNQFYVASYDTLRNELHVSDPGWGHSVFDGTQWQARPAPAVFVRQMAYDPVRDRTVVVGFGPGQVLQTWGFDGSTWGLLATQAPFPEPYGLVWHTQRQTIVAFSDSGLHEWNGTSWQFLAAGGAQPPAAGSHQYDVLYDGVRHVIAVGDRVGLSSGAMWEWSAGPGWQQVVTGSPFGNGVAHFGVDEMRHRYVAFVSPNPATPFTTEEVWEQVPGGAAPWQLRGQSPSSSGNGPMVWDAGQARLLIVSWYLGGPMLGYTGAYPALYTLHGSGCTGSGLLFDELHASSPAALPYAGTSFVAQVGLTQSSLGVLVTGLSDQVASGAPLPMSLSPLGMGNCRLRVSFDLLTVMTPSAPGVLQASVLLGPNPGALGLTFYQQALIFRPGANAFGAVMTNSMRGVKGLP